MLGALGSADKITNVPRANSKKLNGDGPRHVTAPTCGSVLPNFGFVSGHRFSGAELHPS